MLSQNMAFKVQIATASSSTFRIKAWLLQHGQAFHVLHLLSYLISCYSPCSGHLPFLVSSAFKFFLYWEIPVLMGNRTCLTVRNWKVHILIFPAPLASRTQDVTQALQDSLPWVASQWWHPQCPGSGSHQTVLRVHLAALPAFTVIGYWPIFWALIFQSFRSMWLVMCCFSNKCLFHLEVPMVVSIPCTWLCHPPVSSAPFPSFCKFSEVTIAVSTIRLSHCLYCLEHTGSHS